MSTQTHCAAALSLLAGLAVSSGAFAQPCTPEWDVTLGNPGMAGGYVAAFEAFDSGAGPELYATGAFTSAGGAAGTGEIAMWNGSAWESVGGGLQGGYSTTLEVFGDDLIVGGYFDAAGGVAGTAKLARWDGSQWQSMDAQLSSFLSSVWGLKTWDDGNGEDLYVVGNYLDIGGSGLDHIARWDGTQFTEVGGTIGGAGIPLIVFDAENFDDGGGDALYVGGRFKTIAGISAFRVAKWDGNEWSALGDGIADNSAGTGVHTIEVFDDGTGPALFVGGQSIDMAGDVAVSNIAKWDGAEWHDVGGGVNGTVWDMRVFDDGAGDGPALYVVGLFTQAGGVPANRIAKWDGTQWAAVDAGVNDDIFGALVFGDRLIVGGSFLSANGLPTDRVAAYVGCPTDIPGDLNGDGCVDQADLGELLGDWGCTGGDCVGDIDGDGDTDQADLGELLGNYGEGC